MVDTSSAVRRGHPIAFGLFTFIAFIVAVIASTLTHDYNSNNNAPSSGINGATRFLVFAGWWGFVVGVAYTALFLFSVGGVITSIAGHTITLFLTWLFWMAGAAALTDRTGGNFSCDAKGYPYCNSTKALIAFAWIGWILLTFMFVMVLVIGGGAFRGGRSVKESLA